MNKPKINIKDKLAKKPETPPGRVTNDTVAEHRERVLAGGRKFKYPVQYSRHKILLNTILVALAAVLIFAVFSWAMLYKKQTTNDFFFNVTRVLPVPVASVDGVSVRYSDYLLRIRSSLTYLQRNNEMPANPEERARQISFLKRQELDEAQRVAWARSLARANDVVITDDEVNDFITRERESAKTSMSEQAFEKAVLRDFYGWTLDDYRQIVRDRLTLRGVSFAIDDPAREQINKIKQWLDGGSDFAQLAADYSDDELTKMTGGRVGPVSLNSLDSNGLIEAAKKLEPGQISGVIKGVDSYFIIKLNSRDDQTVDYSLIKIQLREFDRQFEKLREEGRIREFIRIDSVETVTEE